MSADWFAGNFAVGTSTWHKLEGHAKMDTAAEMIAAGETSGAWPVEVGLESMVTESGLVVPGSAVVAKYLDGKRVCHKAMSERYRYLDPKEWRATIEAAVKAGAKPIGAFALGGSEDQYGKITSPGGKILATFDIGKSGSGSGELRNHLNLADSLDGSCSYTAGGSSIRVVCANTLAAWLGQDGKAAARIRHTATIGERAEVLRGAIDQHVTSGETVAKLYAEAKRVQLHTDDVMTLLGKLFPVPKANEDGTESKAKSRALRAQRETAAAMLRPENNEGPTLASLWNGATFMVDRAMDEKGNVSHRAGRGGANTMEAMLFGGRGAKVEAIRKLVVTVLRRDGSEEEVTAPEAAALGVDAAQIGRQILGEMMSN